ncbi:hypothetical protein G6F27_013654 [Rhizopus arrhizus]|nr:hypothetical protein G6F27_013654 [Rhizopus arrhizus]
MVDGKFLFPHFDIKSPPIYVFSEELLYGLSKGYRYQLIEGYGFRMSSWGKDFFTTMFQCKLQAEKENNTALRWVFKIMANSGYGFFGYGKYDRSVTKIYGSHMQDHVDCITLNGVAETHRYGDVIVSYETTDVLLDDVNIIVAIAITSYGRVHLHRIIDAVEKRGGSVVYCDTDSLITDYRMEETDMAFMLSDELGALKNEYPNDIIKEATIVSCKLYGFITQSA